MVTLMVSHGMAGTIVTHPGSPAPITGSDTVYVVSEGLLNEWEGRKSIGSGSKFSPVN